MLSPLSETTTAIIERAKEDKVERLVSAPVIGVQANGLYALSVLGTTSELQGVGPDIKNLGQIGDLKSDSELIGGPKLG